MKTRYILIFLIVILLAAFAYTQWYIARIQTSTNPNYASYTMIEPGLYVGGNVPPPPDVSAVLCLTKTQDAYSVRVQEWQPIVDASPPPTLDWLRQQVLFIDTQRRAGLGVYVHCDAGMSRSPMVVAAYLIWRDHLTRDQALQLLRAKRPVIHPNASFMQLLLDWQQTLTPATNEN